MLRLTLSVSLAALLSGCNSGVGDTEAGSVGSTGATATSSSTAGTSTGGAPTTGSDTGGTASASGSSSETTSAGTGTTGTTGAGTTAGTTGTGGVTTGDPVDSSTGEPVGCVNVLADYGACEAELGYGFDGTSCRLFSGCDCAPNCEHFAPDPVGCASACAAEGHCDESKIEGAALAKDQKIGVGTYCDGVDACAPQGSELQAWLAALFPAVTCEDAFPCEAGESCHVQYAGMIDEAQWTRLCAASLLPSAEVYCVIYGP